MNDEQPPPPLRLKPRARPVEDEAAAAEEVPAQPATKLRIKPRLGVEPVASVPVEQSAGDPGAVLPGGLDSSRFKFYALAESEPAPGPVTEGSVATPSVAEVPAPFPSAMEDEASAPAFPTADTPVAVRHAEPEAETVSTNPAQPAPTGETIPDDPPVFPVLAPDLPAAADGSALIGGLTTSGTRAPFAPPAGAEEAVPPPELRKSFRYGVIATTAVLAVVLLGGTYYVLKYFLTPPAVVAEAKAKPTKAAASVASAKKKLAPPVTGASAPAAGTAPSPAPAAREVSAASPASGSAAPVPAPAPAPASSGVVMAKDLFARRAEDPARAGSAAKSAEPGPAGDPAAGARAGTASAPILTATTGLAEATTLAPGVTAQMGTEVKATDASPEFRNFVASARISGVFQGSPARAFINGRLARAGDTVDMTLGVVFDHVDGPKKEIVFKDANGATVARKY